MAGNTAGQTGGSPFRKAGDTADQGSRRYTGQGNSTGIARAAKARVARAKATPGPLSARFAAAPAAPNVVNRPRSEDRSYGPIVGTR